MRVLLGSYTKWRKRMARNLLFKPLHVFVTAVLFCGLMGCGGEVYIENQTQDNIRLDGVHIEQGERVFFTYSQPGDIRKEHYISRKYGSLGILFISCPEDLDLQDVPRDTIVITEPERDIFQATAHVLGVSIFNGNPEEYDDMSAQDLFEYTKSNRDPTS